MKIYILNNSVILKNSKPTLLLVAMCFLHQVNKIVCLEQEGWQGSKELMSKICFCNYLCPSSTGRLRGGRAPEKFSRLLLERKDLNFGDSEDHKNDFWYSAARVLTAVQMPARPQVWQTQVQWISFGLLHQLHWWGILDCAGGKPHEARWCS